MTHFIRGTGFITITVPGGTVMTRTGMITAAARAITTMIPPAAAAGIRPIFITREAGGITTEGVYSTRKKSQTVPRDHRCLPV